MKLPLARRAAATCAIIVRLKSFPRLLPPPRIMSKPKGNEIRHSSAARRKERKNDNLHGDKRGSGVSVAHSAAAKQRMQHCTFHHLVTTDQ